MSTAELATLATQKPKKPAFKVLRDSHHMVARLFASGLGQKQVAKATGYSIARVHTLHADPAFQNLVEEYRSSVDQSWRENVDEYFELISANRIKAARLISDKLDSIEDPDDVSFRELTTIHADAADRTGYPKRSVAVNVNLDFAARLEQAIKRSEGAKVIENIPTPEPIRELPAPVAQPLRRRA